MQFAPGGVEPPCLSLYQPTHRAAPASDQDAIRFRNLVRTLEDSLRRQYARRDADALLAPFRALAADEAFWRHGREGLAVLGAKDFFHVYRLQRPVPELAVAADSFHLKPLLRIEQSADRYQILALGRDAVRLFEGNRDVLDEIELDPEVPRTRAEALVERKEPHLEAWTYHAGSSGPEAGAAVVQGMGGEKAPEQERRTERFFRVVDRAVLEKHSRTGGLPLLLAALPENQARFRALSRNPFLLPEGIDSDPQALSPETLRERAWQILEPHYLERLAGLVDMFGAARSRELGSDDLGEVARGAAAGRVATLLIEAGRQIPGRIDRESGAIERAADLADPDVDDLLDDVGELALRNGGQVVIVPPQRMPTRSGVAAIYRY